MNLKFLIPVLKVLNKTLNYFMSFVSDFAICVTNDDKVYASVIIIKSKDILDMKRKKLLTIMY